MSTILLPAQLQVLRGCDQEFHTKAASGLFAKGLLAGGKNFVAKSWAPALKFLGAGARAVGEGAGPKSLWSRAGNFLTGAGERAHAYGRDAMGAFTREAIKQKGSAEAARGLVRWSTRGGGALAGLAGGLGSQVPYIGPLISGASFGPVGMGIDAAAGAIGLAGRKGAEEGSRQTQAALANYYANLPWFKRMGMSLNPAALREAMIKNDPRMARYFQS